MSEAVLLTEIMVCWLRSQKKTICLTSFNFPL